MATDSQYAPKYGDYNKDNAQWFRDFERVWSAYVIQYRARKEGLTIREYLSKHTDFLQNDTNDPNKPRACPQSKKYYDNHK